MAASSVGAEGDASSRIGTVGGGGDIVSGCEGNGGSGESEGGDGEGKGGASNGGEVGGEGDGGEGTGGGGDGPGGSGEGGGGADATFQRPHAFGVACHMAPRPVESVALPLTPVLEVG